ncbi:MAG: hypothetical protein QOJ99_2073 [Bryobacterales bacterium]|nr:hypothetical protein [Bryobacterales bacterium]
MHNSLSAWAAASLLLLSACSMAPSRQTKVYQAGEKAAVDKLTYAVIDSQIHPRLGDDPNSPRIPENRFYAVQVAISNGASTEATVPSMTLIDDSGKTYNELADGSGLHHWLGVVRRVAPAQTERGEVLFDAPAAHYRLKLTDDSDKDDVYIDLPLSFVHEQMGSEAGTPDLTNPATGGVPGVITRPAQKK